MIIRKICRSFNLFLICFFFIFIIGCISTATNNNGDLDLNFYNQESISTSGDDILGPLGKWYEKDTVLTGLENNYILSGQQGIDVLGGGSNNDVLDGGEELYQDQYGNDVDENGLLGLDRLVYYDAPSGINANLITGVIQDGYGSVDQISNFERF